MVRSVVSVSALLTPAPTSPVVSRVTPAMLLIVRLKNEVALLPPMVSEEVPLKLIVSVPLVYVPLFDQLRLTFTVCAPDINNGALGLIVTLPFTVRAPASVHVLFPVFVMVRLL